MKQISEDAIKDIEVFPQQNINNETFILKKESRSECFECLLKGESEKDGCINEDGGLIGLLFNSLRPCSSDIRYSCMKHVIFCGGGATIPGLILHTSQLHYIYVLIHIHHIYL